MLDFELNWSKIFPNGQIPESFATSSPFPRVPLYASQLENARGYDKSGGWRFGKPTSTQTFQSLYTPEAYNGGLLDKVGNANKGPVTSAVTASPVTNAINTGLLRVDNSYGDGGAGRGPDPANTPDPDSMAGKIAQGIQNVVANTTLGKAAIGLGTLLGADVTPVSVKEMYERVNNPGGASTRTATQGEGGTGGMAAAAAAAAAEAAAANGATPERQAQAAQTAANSVLSGMTKDDAVNGATAVDRSGFNGAGYDPGPVGKDGGYDIGDNGAGGYALAKGGPVKGLLGPDPKGPDDGFAALDRGEYVIRKSAVKKYGKGLLDDINSMKFKGDK